MKTFVSYVRAEIERRCQAMTQITLINLTITNEDFFVYVVNSVINYIHPILLLFDPLVLRSLTLFQIFCNVPPELFNLGMVILAQILKGMLFAFKFFSNFVFCIW